MPGHGFVPRTVVMLPTMICACFRHWNLTEKLTTKLLSTGQAEAEASSGSEGQCQTVGGNDAGQGQSSGGDGGNDEECQASNRFELMQPMPKKIFCNKKANAKSRATTSRVLTGKNTYQACRRSYDCLPRKLAKLTKGNKELKRQRIGLCLC